MYHFYLFRHIGMNGRRFPINRSALLIKLEYVREMRGFVAFAIDCRALQPQCIEARQLAIPIAYAVREQRLFGEIN